MDHQLVSDTLLNNQEPIHQLDTLQQDTHPPLELQGQLDTPPLVLLDTPLLPDHVPLVDTLPQALDTLQHQAVHIHHLSPGHIRLLKGQDIPQQDSQEPTLPLPTLVTPAAIHNQATLGQLPGAIPLVLAPLWDTHLLLQLLEAIPKAVLPQVVTPHLLEPLGVTLLVVTPLVQGVQCHLPLLGISRIWTG